MVIDLGYRTRTDDEPDASGPWTRRRQRSGFVALLVAGVLALVAASGATAVNPLPMVASVPIGDEAHMMVQGGRAFILDAHGDTSEISAYALPGGRRLWSSPVGGMALNGNFLISGSTLVVDAPSRGFGDHVAQGFDVATGRQLWQLTTGGVSSTPVGLIASAFDDQGLVGSGYRIQGIDPSNGRAQWTIDVASDCATMVGGDDTASSALIEYCISNRELTVFDLRTGEARAQRQFIAPQTDAGEPLPLLVTGGVIVIAQNNHPGLYATAYRISDLGVLWSGLQARANVAPALCEPNLCLDGVDGIVALNPQTGRPVTVATAVVPTASLRPRTGVLDFVVVPADATSAVDRTDPGVSFMPALPEATAVDVLRFQDSHGVTTWITQQLGDGTFRPVASLQRVGASCVFESIYVACTTAADRLSFYRLPSTPH